MINYEKIVQIEALFKKIPQDIEKSVKPILVSYELPFGAMKIMLVLDEFPYINQKNLSDKFYTSQAAISQLMSILEKKNLVDRIPSKQDKRKFQLCLTDKGKQVVDTCKKEIRDKRLKRYERLSNEDIDNLYDILERMENFEETI